MSSQARMRMSVIKCLVYECVFDLFKGFNAANVNRKNMTLRKQML